MPCLLVDVCGGHVVSIGAYGTRPPVVQGNPFTDGIRLGSTQDGLPRNGSMCTMIGSTTCCELMKALFVSTVHFGFAVAQSPLRGVSKPELLYCRSE
jgi:hypothetical protein